ncbi:hypothetical protein BT93_B0549 [Corymbia citriodora subsp. variegata]|nr:hypothetical protein BT93_B0549 [Corymbia citriodora subsp. variegata]
MYPSLFCSNSISLRMDLTMSCSSLSLLFLISLHVHFLVPASGESPPFEECAPFVFGDQEISYPFRCKEQPSYCGYPGYELGCDGYNPTLSMASLEYRVMRMNISTRILEVTRKDLSEDLCDGAHVNATLNNATLNSSLFDYASHYLNLTLFYDCNSSLPPQHYNLFPCPPSGHVYFDLDADPESQLHKHCKFSVLGRVSPSEAPDLTPPPEGTDYSAFFSRVNKVLKESFEITWTANTSMCENCTNSGGRCGYDSKKRECNCFCKDGANSTTCKQGMYAYSHLMFGFQLADVLPRKRMLGLLVNWTTAISFPENPDNLILLGIPFPLI